MPQKVKGKRILKNGVTAGYVRQKDGSYRFRFLKGSKKNQKGGKVSYNGRSHTFIANRHNFIGREEARFLNNLGVKYITGIPGRITDDLGHYQDFWRYPNNHYANYNFSLEEAVERSVYTPFNVTSFILNCILIRIRQLRPGLGYDGHLYQIQCMMTALYFFNDKGFVAPGELQELTNTIRHKRQGYYGPAIPNFYPIPFRYYRR